MAVNLVWAVFPLKSNIEVRGKPCDVYVIADATETKIVGFMTFIEEFPSQKEVKAAFKKARKTSGGWPEKIFTQKGDSCEELFASIARDYNFKHEVVPTPQLDYLKQPMQDSFDEFQSGKRLSKPFNPEQESVEQARAGIPESYDVCPCGTGKKYKFCCKPIHREVVFAMCAVEEGDFREALKWIKAAKDKVGDTAEIVCREAIVYSLQSEDDYKSKIRDALHRFPKHPRLHYLQGLNHKEAGLLKEAEAAYLAAIERYPPTDKYHLNETWNNLGTVYYDLGEFRLAKNAWEKALGYLPMDVTCKNNLFEFVYGNPNLDDELRTPSPFIVKYL
jgi:hypothetical protein